MIIVKTPADVKISYVDLRLHFGRSGKNSPGGAVVEKSGKITYQSSDYSTYAIHPKSSVRNPHSFDAKISEIVQN